MKTVYTMTFWGITIYYSYWNNSHLQSKMSQVPQPAIKELEYSIEQNNLEN